MANMLHRAHMESSAMESLPKSLCLNSGNEGGLQETMRSVQLCF